MNKTAKPVTTGEQPYAALPSSAAPSPSECINNLVTVVVLAMPQAIADIVHPASMTCSGSLSRLGPLSASITMRVRPFRRECIFEVLRVQV